MQRIALVLAAGAALLSAPALAGDKISGEGRLARILEGREAGEPVACIPQSSTRDTKIIEDTAIVYGAGKVLYVNRPSNADNLDDDAILITKPGAGRLCKNEMVRLRDRSGAGFSGSVGLGEFVPYRRVAANH